ncbi:MAG: O-antigen ligase C-terminal domain-containing protein [Ramlibacter sp.]|nr:O-antigen ligase C-terminal domain-containing protein [Ramlibacter sp.]
MVVTVLSTATAYAVLNRESRGTTIVGALLLVWLLLMLIAPEVMPADVTGLFAGILTIFAWGGVAAQRAEDLEAAFPSILMFVSAVSGLIALCQYFGVSHLFEPWMSAATAGEAYGNLRQRNQLASLTSFGVAALAFGRVRTSWVYLPLAAVLLAANAATASRSGLVQVGLVGVMAGLWSDSLGRRRLRVLLGLLIGYVSATFALPILLQILGDYRTSNVLDRLAAPADCSSRLVLWSNVLDLIQIKPWLGWGWGTLDYAHFMTLYAGERFCDILDNAHNLPLHLAVELGVPVACLCMTAVFVFVVRRHPWREKMQVRRLAWVLLLVLGVHSMVEYPLWFGPFQMTAGICIGLLWRNANCTPRQRVARLQVCWRYALTILIGISALYADWDYQRVRQAYLPFSSRSSVYREDTLSKIGSSRLFQYQVQFAVLTTTPLTRENAADMVVLAKGLLHFSPEPRVIEPLIESLLILERRSEALGFLVRFKAAFPEAYERWLGSQHLRSAEFSQSIDWP